MSDSKIDVRKMVDTSPDTKAEKRERKLDPSIVKAIMENRFAMSNIGLHRSDINMSTIEVDPHNPALSHLLTLEGFRSLNTKLYGKSKADRDVRRVLLAENFPYLPGIEQTSTQSDEGEESEDAIAA